MGRGLVERATTDVLGDEHRAVVVEAHAEQRDDVRCHSRENELASYRSSFRSMVEHSIFTATVLPCQPCSAERYTVPNAPSPSSTIGLSKVMSEGATVATLEGYWSHRLHERYRSRPSSALAASTGAPGRSGARPHALEPFEPTRAFLCWEHLSAISEIRRTRPPARRSAIFAAAFAAPTTSPPTSACYPPGVRRNRGLFRSVGRRRPGRVDRRRRPSAAKAGDALLRDRCGQRERELSAVATVNGRARFEISGRFSSLLVGSIPTSGGEFTSHPTWVPQTPHRVKQSGSRGLYGYVFIAARHAPWHLTDGHDERWSPSGGSVRRVRHVLPPRSYGRAMARPQEAL